MNTKKQKGTVAEARIIAQFVSSGLRVSIPFSEDTPYDLIVDENRVLFRVQCKVGSLSKNGKSIVFNTCSTYVKNKEYIHRGYKGEIEFFAIYCEENSKMYLVPINLVSANRAMTICLVLPDSNSQRSRLNLASDFEYPGSSAVTVSERLAKSSA